MSSNLYYRGDTILLYVKFNDELGNPALNVSSPMVRVIHEKNGGLSVDLDWTNMQQMSSNEFFYSLQIPHDADYGLREVIYSGTVDGQNATVVEDFHVIPSDEIGQDVIKIYGFVNQLRSGRALISASVKISNVDETEIYSESFTKDDGSWECFLYPGEYIFSFNKVGFLPQKVTVQIGDESNEIRFNNIALESEDDLNKGNGVYSVKEKYQTKEGTPLNGLQVNVFSIFALLNDPVAQNVTDDNGEWEVFLDPGMYFVKVSGMSLEEQFDYTFRLKVDSDGTQQFENLSGNVAVPSDISMVGQGDGSITVTDQVLDAVGNPIIDVQVNVFYSTDTQMTNLIAQDYTDYSGTWKVYLNPGSYIFEYYHPDFDSVTENRTIN